MTKAKVDRFTHIMNERYGTPIHERKSVDVKKLIEQLLKDSGQPDNDKADTLRKLLFALDGGDTKSLVNWIKAPVKEAKPKYKIVIPKTVRGSNWVTNNVVKI